MKQLSKQQIKIIYIAAAVLISLILFYILIYIPQGKKISVIKRVLDDTERQISEINQISGGRDLTETVKQLNQRLHDEMGKFGYGEEEVINFLSEAAEKQKIEVKNKLFGEKQQLDERITGCPVEELPINMNLSCDVKSFGEYVNTLRDNPNVLFRITKVDIRKHVENKPNLDIDLSISAYLVKQGAQQ